MARYKPDTWIEYTPKTGAGMQTYDETEDGTQILVHLFPGKSNCVSRHLAERLSSGFDGQFKILDGPSQPEKTDTDGKKNDDNDQKSDKPTVNAEDKRAKVPKGAEDKGA